MPIKKTPGPYLIIPVPFRATWLIALPAHSLIDRVLAASTSDNVPLEDPRPRAVPKIAKTNPSPQVDRAHVGRLKECCWARDPLCLPTHILPRSVSIAGAADYAPGPRPF